MSSVLEERLADNLIKNATAAKPKNKTELLVSSGYSLLTAQRNSAAVMRQIGLQRALQRRGFTVENAKHVVGELLNSSASRPRERLRAAQIIFEVHGTFSPSKQPNIKVNVQELRGEIQSQLAAFRNR